MFTAEERMENEAGEQFHMGLMCCRAHRSFDIGVCDKQGNEVFALKLLLMELFKKLRCVSHRTDRLPQD